MFFLVESAYDLSRCGGTERTSKLSTLNLGGGVNLGVTSLHFALDIWTPLRNSQDFVFVWIFNEIYIYKGLCV